MRKYYYMLLVLIILFVYGNTINIEKSNNNNNKQFVSNVDSQLDELLSSVESVSKSTNIKKPKKSTSLKNNALAVNKPKKLPTATTKTPSTTITTTTTTTTPPIQKVNNNNVNMMKKIRKETKKNRKFEKKQNKKNRKLLFKRIRRKIKGLKYRVFVQQKVIKKSLKKADKGKYLSGRRLQKSYKELIACGEEAKMVKKQLKKLIQQGKRGMHMFKKLQDIVDIVRMEKSSIKDLHFAVRGKDKKLIRKTADKNIKKMFKTKLKKVLNKQKNKKTKKQKTKKKKKNINTKKMPQKDWISIDNEESRLLKEEKREYNIQQEREEYEKKQEMKQLRKEEKEEEYREEKAEKRKEIERMKEKHEKRKEKELKKEKLKEEEHIEEEVHTLHELAGSSMHALSRASMSMKKAAQKYRSSISSKSKPERTASDLIQEDITEANEELHMSLRESKHSNPKQAHRDAIDALNYAVEGVYTASHSEEEAIAVNDRTKESQSLIALKEALELAHIANGMKHATASAWPHHKVKKGTHHDNPNVELEADTVMSASKTETAVGLHTLEESQSLLQHGDYKAAALTATNLIGNMARDVEALTEVEEMGEKKTNNLMSIEESLEFSAHRALTLAHRAVGVLEEAETFAAKHIIVGTSSENAHDSVVRPPKVSKKNKPTILNNHQDRALDIAVQGDQLIHAAEESLNDGNIAQAYHLAIKASEKAARLMDTISKSMHYAAGLKDKRIDKNKLIKKYDSLAEDAELMAKAAKNIQSKALLLK